MIAVDDNYNITIIRGDSGYTEDGYILISKDNVGKAGIFSYVIDVTDAFI